MTKVINLDQLETKKDKAVKLKGVEHVMKTLTVKDYIHQLKTQRELEKLSTQVDENDADTADKILELTINALSELFPTIPREQLEGLNMQQIDAMRALAEEFVADDAPEGEDTGELTGKA